jgi:hypothetical protein
MGYLNPRKFSSSAGKEVHQESAFQQIKTLTEMPLR